MLQPLLSQSWSCSTLLEGLQKARSHYAHLELDDLTEEQMKNELDVLERLAKLSEDDEHTTSDPYMDTTNFLPAETPTTVATPQRAATPERPPPGWASPTAETIPGNPWGALATQADSDSDVEIVGYEVVPYERVEDEGVEIPSTLPHSEGVSPQSGGCVSSAEKATLGSATSPRGTPSYETPVTPAPAPGKSTVTALNSDGTLSDQPACEPFQDVLDEIPDITDQLAPRPQLGQHTLSPEAIRSRARRIFEKRANGEKKVSDQIFDEWKSKGPKRRLLEDIFKMVGYDVETFIAEVEIIKSELESCEIVVQGQFVREEQMYEWGYSEQRVAAIKKHCRSQPDKLLRRDTYEQITLYYVETSITGTHKRASTVNVTKRARFHEKGGLKGLGLAPSSLLGNDPEPVEDGFDLTKSDDDEEGEGKKARKGLGFPVIDPDALPSSLAQKYLTCMAKRISKVAAMRTKFTESTAKLTEIQSQLGSALSSSVTALQEIEVELSTAYTAGVVHGFTEQQEEALRTLLQRAQQKAAESLALEMRARPFVPKPGSDNAGSGGKGSAKAKTAAKAKVKARAKPGAKAKALAKEEKETPPNKKQKK